MTQKITKEKFLELVDLAIAVHGFENLWELGFNHGLEGNKESMDVAIAEYVFWTYTAHESLRKNNPSADIGRRKLLKHWTEG